MMVMPLYIVKDNRSLGIATIGAGEKIWGKVLQGEAVRIMTGAPVPDDCDTIVMQEAAVCAPMMDTVAAFAGARRNGTYGLRYFSKRRYWKGENIIPEGEECAEGIYWWMVVF